MASRGRGRGRRGRPRKPRETRMDAALDAMKEYGFKEKDIKQAVKELLEVYGGTQAWPHIEDHGYSMLLEVILSNQEGENGEAGPSQTGANQPEETMASEPLNGDTEQNLDTAPIGSMEPPNNAELPIPDIIENAPNNDNTGMEDSRGLDVTLMAPVISSDVNLGNTNTELSLAILPPQAPGGTIPKKRRRPCYGWIDDDDEDLNDIVHLRPS
nr:PREDICTED: uncharacterized protein LOC108198388 [Daucus carota subsp. sativus]XP_017221631.1 PREDICTED: uncharacterized protein LOC108198390 [Daucus carota subsp. sativus]